jgi:hypothetical protein
MTDATVTSMFPSRVTRGVFRHALERRTGQDTSVGIRSTLAQLCMVLAASCARTGSRVFARQIRRLFADLRATVSVARGLLFTPATIVNATLSRVTACWLVALVMLPFTAPFRTCDLAAFFGARAQQAPISRTSSSGTATLATDSSVANVPAISRIGRVRLLEPAGASPSAAESLCALTTVTVSAGFSRVLRERAVLSTILRV